MTFSQLSDSEQGMEYVQHGSVSALTPTALYIVRSINHILFYLVSPHYLLVIFIRFKALTVCGGYRNDRGDIYSNNDDDCNAPAKAKQLFFFSCILRRPVDCGEGGRYGCAE